MEKLLNLLNEYEQLNMCRKFDCFEMHTFENSNGVDRLLEDTIISRRYGFIEWLYDHKKMKLERLKFSDLYWDINDWVGPVDNIIMHLSISEKPIDLLISILK